MKLFLEIQNHNKKGMAYTVDGGKRRRLPKKELIEKEIELDEGSHTLVLEKRTWVDTPLCYLNMINPWLYLWQFKFSNSIFRHFNSVFSELEISFEATEQNAEVTLCLQENPLGERSKGEFKCLSANRLKNAAIKENGTNLKKVRRYKRTYLLLNLFYMLLLSFFLLADMVKRNTAVREDVFMIAVIVVVSLFSIWRKYNEFDDRRFRKTIVNLTRPR